jgi:SAM-dependent methyltransferase
LLEADLPDNSFDVITCVSVIEHFEGRSDTNAMRRFAKLLRPGGVLLLTTPVNGEHFAEFYVKRSIYGETYSDKPVFYQRHYDVESVSSRLVDPSGLREVGRTYFGDYEFQCFEGVLQASRPLRALIGWMKPWLATRYMSFRPYPVSRSDMRMNTASGVALVLSAPAAE